ncbi:IS982 family transposase [Lactobacillus sp. AN1001]
MSDTLKFKHYRHNLQVKFHSIRKIVRFLYDNYCPNNLKNRKNISLSKVSDIDIISEYFLMLLIRQKSQRFFFKLFPVLFPRRTMLERSRFNRRLNQLLPVINAIRVNLTKHVIIPDDTAIIDSFPVLVCNPIRNFRAKLFKGVANIGFNATKNISFYGFKVHMCTTTSGYILNYVVTEASVHDAKVAETLIDKCPASKILADVGYVGQKLQDNFAQKGYQLWTPYRSNMKKAKEHNKSSLKKIRRRIETYFWILNNKFEIEYNTVHTLTGFQVRLEAICLLQNLEFFVLNSN